VQQLTLKVAVVHDIEIDDPNASDSGSGQVHRRRRPESSRSDAEDTRSFQLSLTVDADLRHDEMPAVPPNLLL
jgi:hypothetical protein